MLSSLPAPMPNLILMGDFNFPARAMTWQSSEDGCLIPILGNHREAETVGWKRDCIQHLIDLASKFSLQRLEHVDHFKARKKRKKKEKLVWLPL